MWNMNDVKEINYEDSYIYYITFDNGVSGEVDFLEYINKGSIFAPLRDKDFLKKQLLKVERYLGQMALMLHQKRYMIK